MLSASCHRSGCPHPAINRGQSSSTCIGLKLQVQPCITRHRCVSVSAHGSRDKGREREASRGGPGGAGPAAAWVVPSQLVVADYTTEQEAPPEGDTPLTVYTIRMATGFARGAALSDPNSGVTVCLIAKDGRAALHRIAPVNDPLESRAHTVEMCQLVELDDTIGADCSQVISEAASLPQQPSSSGAASGPAQRASSGTSAASASSSTQPPPAMVRTVGRAPPPPPPKRRFQAGSVDEVSILCPELGPLAAVLVGTEQGSWYLDEMDICSSRTNHIDRFVCRRMLGAKAGEGAACLAPVPPGAVVYGEGEAAVLLTKDQADALYSLNLSQYDDFKTRMLAMTAMLVAGGVSVAGLTGGSTAAIPFLAGGVTGLVYQWLLMQGVDHVVAKAAAPTPMPTLPPPPAGTTVPHTPAMPSRPSGGAGRMAPGIPPHPHPHPPPLPPGATAQRIPGHGHSLEKAVPPPPADEALRRMLGNPAVRLSFVCAAAAIGFVLLAGEEPSGVVTGDVMASGTVNHTRALQLALAAVGFFSYKVALIGASLVGTSDTATPPPAAPGSQELLRSHSTEYEKFKRD